MASIREQLQFGFESLSGADVAEPAREASLLLQFALARDKTFLVAHPEYELTEAEGKLYRSVLERRTNHEPYQYIIGRQEFYGLDFIVTPDVLIPRPETEILVEDAIRLMRENGWKRFCEIGVGSGCIAVSILINVPNVTAVGGDISSGALDVARRNAETHDVLDRLALKLSNIFADIDTEKFDLIVSNPPYVPLTDISGLQAEVRDHEPHIALTDGGDGLSIVREIVSGAKDRLRHQGVLLIEIGWDQSERIKAMFDLSEWTSVQFLPDLQGIPRILKAVRVGQKRER
jgi:release factor glutamine methyltransferase